MRYEVYTSLGAKGLNNPIGHCMQLDYVPEIWYLLFALSLLTLVFILYMTISFIITDKCVPINRYHLESFLV